MDAYLVNSVHPATLKHALKGHPWITKDEFSTTWPKEKNLLLIKVNREQTFTYLHDPNHSFCVARLIAQIKISSLDELHLLVKERIQLSIKKRLSSDILKKRNHCWLVFAEADELPGLYLNYLNGHLVIQTHIDYWEKLLPNIIEWIEAICVTEKLPLINFWWQKRSQGQHLPVCYIDKKFQSADKTFWVEEAGFKMQVNLGARYDYGIYTDMSGIREILSLENNLLKDKSVLNLFCYTGAFSLWALKHQAHYCCSLDSSYKYLNILKSNLIENNIPETQHKTLESDLFKGLYHFQEKRNQFDLIILDPPSSFTSQQKKVQAFQIYPEMLKQISKIASPKAYLLCFLNHHQKTRNQFETMVKASLPQWKITKQLQLSEDAPLLPYFPEGDYLKGLLLQKK